MKKTCAQIKDSARNVLIGHYSVLIAATLIIGLVTLLLSTPFSTRIEQGFAYQLPFYIVTGYAGMLLVSVFANLLIAGLRFMHLQISRNGAIRISDLLYPFKNRPDKYIGYSCLTLLISFLCTLPETLYSYIAGIDVSDVSTIQFSAPMLIDIFLFLAGIIVYIWIMFGMFLSIYLLLDRPELTVMEAIRLSFSRMRGNKFRLLKLYLSFIGWLLLGVCTLFIGYLWIVPYMLQSVTEFYQDLIGEPDNE
jgi:uncharacterized membrane protein